MKASMDREYKVGTEDGDGHYLTIAPAPDFPDAGVILHSEGEKNKEFWGEVYLQGGTDLMRKIGEALIACANDVEKRT